MLVHFNKYEILCLSLSNRIQIKYRSLIRQETFCIFLPYPCVAEQHSVFKIYFSQNSSDQITSTEAKIRV